MPEDASSLPVIAIAGRPNVGKSTLFNRLTSSRHALVDDAPGVTRDVREGRASLGDLDFLLLDTAGLEEAERGSLQARMTERSLSAFASASAVLLVLDGRAGITPADRHFAAALRKSGKPVIVLVNKAENEKAVEAALAEAHGLGFGAPIPVSAAHGEGLAGLHEALLPYVSVEMPSEEKEPPLSLAVIGRPNAGKSTLVNKLLGEERVLTGPEAGITRDAIAIPFSFRGQALKLVDTAGQRRKSNVHEAVEKMAVEDALRAVRYAQVVILVLDATMALEKQDNHLAALVEEEGRALVIALNKWDLVEKKAEYLKAFKERLEAVLPQVKGIAVVPISAERAEGLEALMKAALAAYDLWNTRIPTGELNRWLEKALAAHQPPLIDGRRLKIRYATQAKTRPPAITLFSNLSAMPEHYERYLVNSLREAFGLKGVPIRLKLRKNKNPYEGKRVKMS